MYEPHLNMLWCCVLVVHVSSPFNNLLKRTKQNLNYEINLIPLIE
jgi:hypothetical protein